MTRIRKFVEDEALAWRRLGQQTPIHDFVLEFGSERLGQPFDGEPMTPKECYRNALHIAMKQDLLYVEGFAHRRGMPLVIQHAWCETSDGRVVDPTWRDPQEAEYFGVAFNWERVWELTSRLGYYGLYDSGMGINVDLIEEEARRRRQTT